MWWLLYIFKAERYLWTNERKSTIPEKNLTGRVGDILGPPSSVSLWNFSFFFFTSWNSTHNKAPPTPENSTNFCYIPWKFQGQIFHILSLPPPPVCLFFWNSPILTINDYSYTYLDITYFRFVVASLATSLAIFLLGLLRMGTTAQIKYLAN